MRKIDTAAVILGVGLLVAGIGCKGGGDTSTAANPTPGQTATTPNSQAQAVLDLFDQKCMPCHASGKPSGGLALDSIDGIMKGVVKNDPEKSDIIIRLKGLDGKMTMPLNRAKLSDEEIKSVEDWINAGAPTS